MREGSGRCVCVNDSTPKDDEPTSFAEKTKHWYERHKPKIRIIVGGVTLAVGLAAAVYLATRQDGEGYDVEDVRDSEPVSDREATDEPRQSCLDPDRDPFLRRLHPDHRASEDAKARFKELMGKDLPPGYTLVRRWMFMNPDDDASGEAAA